MAFCFIHIELFKWFFFRFHLYMRLIIAVRLYGKWHASPTLYWHSRVWGKYWDLLFHLFHLFVCSAECMCGRDDGSGGGGNVDWHWKWQQWATKTRNSRRNMIFYLVKQKFMMFTLLISTAMAYGSTAIISISFGQTILFTLRQVLRNFWDFYYDFH